MYVKRFYSLAHCFYFRLTRREKKELAYKKTVLQLAKGHKNAGEREKEGRYYMPKDDEVRTSLLVFPFSTPHSHFFK